MKSSAERQRMFRAKQKTLGTRKQINAWISAEALQALAKIANERNETQTQTLNALLMLAINVVKNSDITKVEVDASCRSESICRDVQQEATASLTRENCKRQIVRKDAVSLPIQHDLF